LIDIDQCVVKLKRGRRAARYATEPFGLRHSGREFGAGLKLFRAFAHRILAMRGQADARASYAVRAPPARRFATAKSTTYAIDLRTARPCAAATPTFAALPELVSRISGVATRHGPSHPPTVRMRMLTAASPDVQLAPFRLS
jgi:hypothetical protein